MKTAGYLPMPNKRDVTALKTLSGSRLEAFCEYWNSGSGPAGSGQKAKYPKIESRSEYRTAYLISDAEFS